MLMGKALLLSIGMGGNKKLISNVLYLPNLTQIVFNFVRQLIQKGFFISLFQQ